jgi:hypothetical protein
VAASCSVSGTPRANWDMVSTIKPRSITLS